MPIQSLSAKKRDARKQRHQRTAGYVLDTCLVDSVVNAWIQSENVVRDSAECRLVLKMQYKKTLTNFLCVLKFQRSFDDLMNAGDQGMLKIVGLLKPHILPPQIAARITMANEARDAEFIQNLASARIKECGFDARALKNVHAKAFLYMNWNFQFTRPALRRALWTFSNAQILEFLQYLNPPVEWEDGHLRSALHTLGLRRPEELRSLRTFQ
jgi:hypothetical protein